MNKENKTIWQFEVVKYLLYIIAFTIPLWFNSSLIYQFVILKYHLLTLFTIISVVFACWGLLAEGKFKWSLNLVEASLIVFISILTISSIFGIDKINSFFGWGNSVNLFYLYILVIFSLLVGFITKKDKNFIPNILAASLISSIVVTIIFYAGSLIPSANNDGSTLGNNSYLGEYLFFNVLFGLGLFLYYKKYWQKILVAMGTLFIFISPVFINKDVLIGKVGILEAIKNPLLFMGEANGALMGVGISVFTFLILLLVASRKKILKVVGVLLFASFIFGIYYAGQELVNPSSQLHKVYVEQKGGNRFVAWDIARGIFVENPLLGVGVNNYIFKFENKFDPILYHDGYSVEKFYQPHNIFWDFASNTGILGLLSFLLLLFITFISFYNYCVRREFEQDKRSRVLFLVFNGLLFGYFIQNLFVFDTVTTYLMIFLVVGFASGINNNIFSFTQNVSRKIFLIITIFVSIVTIYPFVILPWVESYYWGRLITDNKAPLEFTIDNKEIQNISLMGDVLDSTHMAEKLFPVLQKKMPAINNEVKPNYLKVLNYIATTVEKDAEKQHDYSDSYLVVGGYLNLYMMTEIKNDQSIVFNGKGYSKDIWDRSYKALNKAIEISPNDPKIYDALIKTYLIKGDLKTAKDILKQSLNIAPWNKDSYKLGRQLLGVPDKDFENYLNEMEAKWINK